MGIAEQERSQPVADLSTRLAEFDRKLRQIQSELVPGRSPPSLGTATPTPLEAPPPERAAPPEPEAVGAARGRSGPLADLLQHVPPPSARATGAQLDHLGRLLSSLHEVLNGIEELLATMAPGRQEATIAAGPFGRIEEVREFERRLSGVRGVRDVTVRGYEGAARAIIDVQFGEDH